ncbi:hypothetical protein AVEN_227187-1, partial [Araneus ventricosus]
MTGGCLFPTVADLKAVDLLTRVTLLFLDVSRFLFVTRDSPMFLEASWILFVTLDTLLFLEVTCDTLVS